MFRLAVPARTVFPSAGLRFEFRGANGRSEIVVAAPDVASNGLIGDLRLAVALAPLPQSIVASLIDLLPDGRQLRALGQAPGRNRAADALFELREERRRMPGVHRDRRHDKCDCTSTVVQVKPDAEALALPRRAGVEASRLRGFEQSRPR